LFGRGGILSTGSEGSVDPTDMKSEINSKHFILIKTIVVS
jgi:hypothetical protein